MYNPAAFREEKPENIRAVIERYPLATLVTAGPGGITASHLPMLYDPGDGNAGVLRGHLARANPQWRDPAPREALAIFSGPEHYVSPAWYPSKREHGKVVPTWNYVVVHAQGTVRFVEDRAWLLANVKALSELHEKLQGTGWKVEDAPPGFIDSMVQAIIGVEFTIASWEGKAKASQNRSAADREGVIAALEHLPSTAAGEMARVVKSKLEKE
jgi:transcriptional regulator